MNVPLVAPAGITILAAAGVATVGAVLDSVTGRPPEGAAHSRKTVPLAFWPPLTGLGLSTTRFARGGPTVSARVTLVPPPVAMTLPVTGEATGLPLNWKVAVVFPAGTSTLAGSVAAGLLFWSFTSVPLAGAGASTVTRPV